jgi:hypothetical protein
LFDIVKAQKKNRTLCGLVCQRLCRWYHFDGFFWKTKEFITLKYGIPSLSAIMVCFTLF